MAYTIFSRASVAAVLSYVSAVIKGDPTARQRFDKLIYTSNPNSSPYFFSQNIQEFCNFLIQKHSDGRFDSFEIRGSKDRNNGRSETTMLVNPTQKKIYILYSGNQTDETICRALSKDLVHIILLLSSDPKNLDKQHENTPFKNYPEANFDYFDIMFNPNTIMNKTAVNVSAINHLKETSWRGDAFNAQHAIETGATVLMDMLSVSYDVVKNIHTQKTDTDESPNKVTFDTVIIQRIKNDHLQYINIGDKYKEYSNLLK